MGRLAVGALIEPVALTALDGSAIAVPGPGRVHLQFRRFAGCPICSLHLRGFADRHAEIAAAGITEVAFFHSAAENLRGYQADLPFAVIADPERVYYRRFGVEKGLRSLANPRALAAAVRGGRQWMAHRDNPDWAGVGENDGTTHLGLPADFLIDADGTLVAVHYGSHADDQWSVDELLEISANS
ncbi:peroxiredoxin-like family protein [Mycobacterium sp. M26]|uniref:peroxiredoxin-like family protein n=1 Tax=Mycobacterium sp. M26 TaxID=1762962 RepID=UPI00073E1E12|nr:peroxiredoxin-like family protein [Mycobacterium sp. M26]